jgi:recombination protein RecT
MADTAVSAPRTDLRSLITGDAMKRQFAMALPKVLPIDRFLRCLLTTVGRDPKLMECDKQSVMAGAMTAAQLGLEIDPALGRAYLLPYRDSKRGMIAQLIVGYKGFVDLFYRSGMADGIQASEVYERDHFRVVRGLNPVLEHEPFDGDDAGPLRCAYAIASLKGGGKVWEVATKRDIARARKASRGANSDYSPWNTAEGEMWKKTAIRKLAKLLPLSPELRDAIAHDDDGPSQLADASLPTAFSDDIAPKTQETTAETVAEEAKA